MYLIIFRKYLKERQVQKKIRIRETMERITPVVLLVSLLIMFASVVNQTRAKCADGLGTCENCDERCKAKHGPSSESICDLSLGMPLCMCYYQCADPPPTPTPPKICNGGAGLCSARCFGSCCDTNCAQKFNGGHGFCSTLGTFNLCQCQYPC
ncbi:PREDICTED: defensin-like protein 182 isoform X1 [Brassica oleracea var. oleracea]|uniref:Defensin-like protein n=1 Tax=Brassica oleracea var. oleracea TaxID=109376 RepID=A0A0D3DI64_BRAOL|nr:PREDICTED: defensin-like protein 182 isoform X1 [Brassica oleracea var. oleracea]